MTTKILINIFLLLQLSVNLLQCLVEEPNPEHTVETCYTKERKPAFCVDHTICNRYVKSESLESLEKCPNSDKVCCSLTEGSDYRDSFVLPSGLAWDWASSWPSKPWGTVSLKPTPSPRPPAAVPPAAAATSASPVSTIVASSDPTPTSVNLNKGCGVRSNINFKDDDDLGFIVGGTISVPNSWPWAVAVNISGRFVCGASIIDSRHILCAAHCVSHKNVITKGDYVKLLVGAHQRTKSGEYYGVQQVIRHMSYDENKMQNDIALFRTDRPITFGKNVAPVCLPTSCDQCSDSDKKNVTIAGWGTTSSGGRVSEVLQEVTVPVIPVKNCADIYGASMVTKQQLCAGVLGKGGMDSCQGDSGGPLVVRPQAKENKYVQCGVVSWGRGCADKAYPGVYTNVCQFRDWIRDNTKI